MQDLPQSLLILLVGGDAAARLGVSEALRSHHPQAQIHEGAGCAEATQATRARRFDCVFLDHQLPDGNGLVWLQGLRAGGDLTPAVLLTDHGDEARAAEALDLGAVDALRKSDLTPPLLGHCLRGALRLHQSQQQTRRAQEESRLRDRALAAASNGIIICDSPRSDWPIVYCNPAFSAMTGYPPEEVLGRNCRFLQGADTDDRYVQQVRDCLREGRGGRIVLLNYRKDGTPFWNELTLSPVRGAGGTLTHFVGVQTDITERRDAEDALRRNVARQQAVLRDMFSSVTGGRLTLCASEDELPPPLRRYADPVSLSVTGGIRELRRQTLDAGTAAGLPDARAIDLEMAVGEAAMNAVVHSGLGIGHVSTGAGGTVQVRVEDRGQGITMADLPHATLRRGYSTAGSMGHGFKIILETVDRVHLLTGGSGTRVVLEQDRVPRPPAWLQL